MSSAEDEGCMKYKIAKFLKSKNPLSIIKPKPKPLHPGQNGIGQ
jgi:hypothetical protein